MLIVPVIPKAEIGLILLFKLMPLLSLKVPDLLLQLGDFFYVPWVSHVLLVASVSVSMGSTIPATTMISSISRGLTPALL